MDTYSPAAVRGLFARLDGWLPESLRTPSEQRRRARSVLLASLAIGTLAALIGLLLLSDLGPGPTFTLFVAGTVLMFGNVFVLRHSVELAGTLVCVELLVFLLGMAVFQGGAASASLLWNPAVPLLAAFLVGPRLVWITGAIVTVEPWVLWWLARSGVAFPRPLDDAAMDWWHVVGLGSFSLFTAMFAWYYEHARRRELARQRSDLDAQRLLYGEMMAARDQAQDATRAKSQFLANMSHEIRTPLNAVIGMAGLLLETELGERQREYAKTIQSSGDALLDVINDVLDFSKVEAGSIELEAASFDLRTCVEDALDQLAPAASGKELNLAYLAAASCPRRVIGDRARVRQVLVNLLSNAVKFTPTGEVVVELSAESLGGTARRVQIEVRDTGIGIPDDRLESVFGSFSQVDASTTRRYGGTGLGLTISRRLAELMGGELTVQSAVGVGSTFTFRFRCQVCDEEVEEPHDSAVQPMLGGRRVLIVDDIATNRRILSLQTTSWGMEPIAVASAAEALERLDGETYDLCILDMQMPDMDGLQLAAVIRERHGARLPLVMLTSIGMIDDVELTRLGFAASLTKPIKPSSLYETLLSVVAGTGRRRRVREPMPAFDLRILLAEDHPVNQKVALKLLQTLRCTAEVVGDGRAAVEAVAREPFDVVLMDLQMPELDGIEATRLIRQSCGDGRKPWIIAMTADVTTQSREAALDAGMNDYLSKPVRLRTLADALQRSRGGTGEGAPAARAPAGVAIDLGPLLEDVGAEGVAHLLQIYLDSLAGYVDKISAAIAAGDPNLLQRAAHTLKGSSQAIGAGPVAELCLALEELGRAGSTEGAAEKLEALRARIAQLEASPALRAALEG